MGNASPWAGSGTRVISSRLDNRTISREMVPPITTADGANILDPNWLAINPVLMALFGE